MMMLLMLPTMLFHGDQKLRRRLPPLCGTNGFGRFVEPSYESLVVGGACLDGVGVGVGVGFGGGIDVVTPHVVCGCS